MPGISAVKTGIPFSKKGFNFSSYWATLISATVETAAPTHVVLTFPAPADIDETDFSIPGFTFASGSWAGAVLTLVLSSPVLAYHGNLTITFTKTGTTATVTNNVAIANTAGWYAFGDGSATYVTKDGSDFVSVWKDLSGANHHLNQGTGTNQPKWESDGILFDGIDNFMNTAFAQSQPVYIYMVWKQITWTDNDRIFDGNTVNTAMLHQRTTAPKLIAFSDLASTAFDVTLNQFIILRVLYNGANSKAIVNNGVPITGNFGSGNPNGIYIGSAALGAYPSNIKVKELIYRNNSDTASIETAIYNYLANKYGFLTI